MEGPPLYTVGHGTLPAESFASLLVGADIRRVVDVRSFPGSRRHPHFGREAMERWLADAGVSYSWIRELGGRRRPVVPSKHTALRHDAFRAYADHMGTAAFLAGIDELLAATRSDASAVMCSESLWWRCHRRLLADHVEGVRGIEVVHLMHDGRLSPHIVTDGARVADDGLVYDLGATSSLWPDEDAVPGHPGTPSSSSTPIVLRKPETQR